MAVRRRYEKRSFGNALVTYLQTAGFSGITYSEGYISDQAIQPPQIAVTFLPSNNKSLQLGRIPGQESLFRRLVQIDAYMEDEHRAEAIIDFIMDFIDLTPVAIVDPSSNTIGSLICYNTEGINGEALPPISTDPKIGKWRGVVRAELEAFYPNS